MPDDTRACHSGGGSLAELVPSATTIGALLNPNNSNFQNRSNDLMAAARAIGRELRIVVASNASELENAFSSAVEQRVGDVSQSSRRNRDLGEPE
jgi:ABC-type uncharacterized transport system substrate-binding protein